MSAGQQKEVLIPLAGYADKQAKLALVFGKWWKHYVDALAYLDELRFGEQKFFLFAEPDEEQLSAGRNAGKNRFDVELALPVDEIASKELLSQEVYDAMTKYVTEFYLSRGLDDMQESVPPGYRVAAASDVSYIDKSSGAAFPKKAALDVAELTAQIAREIEERRKAQAEAKAP
ncbi:MAG: hypothetical protein JRN23_06690 [Nitrososphaerota archaeon]|nr:hypothetical protein [Nitrososphaerota archaeon]MDG7022752.1 hypothetical protein [Nitrososphaerota archaeon]